MLGNRFGNVGEIGMYTAMHICSARDDQNGKVALQSQHTRNSVLISGGTGEGSASITIIT
jgi:hypothetical protein